MERAIRALSKDDTAVQIAWVDDSAPKPAGLDLLFDLERMLLKRGAVDGSRATSVGMIDRGSSAGQTADVVIDFSSELVTPTGLSKQRFKPLYNGIAGENGLLQAILDGDLPRIDIVDESRSAVVASAYPSAEAAQGLSGALDTVMARTITLLSGLLSGGLAVADQHVSRRSVDAAEVRSPVPYVLAGLTRSLAREIYRLCCYSPHWHVGWRMVEGGGVWERGDLSGVAWRVAPDPGMRFYADPFPMTWQGKTFVFVEELDHRVGKGFISAIEFDQTGPTAAAMPVLEESWHLSYPFLMVHDGSLWMIPESMASHEVALYRCVDFPHRWERHATLLSNLQLSDATVTEHNGRYYMFGTLWDGAGGYSDTLAIYHADSLLGPWHPHAKNPVLIDRSSARPAGAFVKRGDRLWRPIQDCSEGYGSGLALAEVVELSPDAFRQTVHRRLKPSQQWPGRKLHTLNRCGRLEVIDGTTIRPKLFPHLFVK